VDAPPLPVEPPVLAEPPDPVVPPLAEAPPVAELPPLPPLLDESGPVEQAALAVTNTAKTEDRVTEKDERFADRGRTSGTVRAPGHVPRIREDPRPLGRSAAREP
jgi:hypothetical protein